MCKPYRRQVLYSDGLVWEHLFSRHVDFRLFEWYNLICSGVSLCNMRHDALLTKEP